MWFIGQNTHSLPTKNVGERTMLERQDYEEFRKAVRRLAETKIQPHAADVDEKKRFPEEALAAFKDLQLIALPFDESIGGLNHLF